ncbi:MAG: PIN domain-containing protein [Candidatus Omnitrophota bacterium]|nr:PIN domain-containing protein [Candidatus Omnitrophota bacterium]
MSVTPILVDSSVWIDYYRPQGPAALKHRLQEELRLGTVATIGLIAVEILQGAPTPSALASLEEDLLGLQWLEITQDVWLEAGRLGARLRQAGLSLPATDVVIASTAMHYRCYLWHRDEDFTRLARHASSLHAITLP